MKCEWISVEDKPELIRGYSDFVAVLNKYGNWYRSRWDSYAGYWEEFETGCISDEITHWLSLPKKHYAEDDK